jgi:hypothetical protein
MGHIRSFIDGILQVQDTRYLSQITLCRPFVLIHMLNEDYKGDGRGIDTLLPLSQLHYVLYHL